MLIDLDMAVPLGTPVGAKQLSTAFVGPETTHEMVDANGGATAEFRKVTLTLTCTLTLTFTLTLAFTLTLTLAFTLTQTLVPTFIHHLHPSPLSKADAYENGVAKLPLKAPVGANYDAAEGYSPDGLLLAHPTFDLWSYGVVLYYAIAHKPLLETTGADQLRGKAERVKLARWSIADLTYAINDLDHGECVRM